MNMQSNNPINAMSIMNQNHGYGSFATNRPVSPAAVMSKTHRARTYRAQQEQAFAEAQPGFGVDSQTVRRVVQESIEVMMMNMGDLLVK